MHLSLLISALVILLTSNLWGRSVFSNPAIQSRYSPLLQEKNAKADSLLPALDGDAAFSELLRGRPSLWSIERLDKYGEVVTQLKIDLVYIDGIREEQFCNLQKGVQSSEDEWALSIGVDFTSGGSNTVEVHVQQCLDFVRNELGYRVRKNDRIVTIPPRKVVEEIKQSHIPSVLDVDLQARVLNAHREVKVKGECPTDIDAYIVLLEVWNQVKDLPMDLVTVNDALNPKRNGGRQVHSCAFSREWNRRYSEQASLNCDIDQGTCVYKQSEDGKTRWKLDDSTNTLVFEPLRILFLTFGGKSVRKGGTMLDLRLIPLSTALFLEAYLDEKGRPAALGLVTIPLP